MGLEIERRFLVSSDEWKAVAFNAKKFRQCYLIVSSEGITVRVRISADKQSWLTLKAPERGIIRHEFEYLIPFRDAQEIWKLSKHRLIKTRYQLVKADGDWVVDCFEGANSPLVIAEVELSRENFPIDVPAWCGREVTGDSGFSNVALAQIPFSQWPSKQQNDCLRAK